MADTRGVLIIGTDAVLTGEIKNSRLVEVHGLIDGGIAAGNVIVHEGGRVVGKVRSDTADIHGTLEGDVRVQNLIAIKSTGTVSGVVKYGRLSMEEGAELAANVRNVPPSISGDLDLTVARGGRARITRSDLSAHDPDDTADKLTFSVSNVYGGFLARASAPGQAISTFTQADLSEGKIYFVHDGGSDNSAKFNVVVTDDAGATSGAAKTVAVAVRG
jgi:cytoskeletal protein CcmA (bactofilin family)